MSYSDKSEFTTDDYIREFVFNQKKERLREIHNQLKKLQHIFGKEFQILFDHAYFSQSPSSITIIPKSFIILTIFYRPDLIIQSCFIPSITINYSIENVLKMMLTYCAEKK